MRDMVFLLEKIKQAAIEAINSTDPVTVRYGTVTGTNPLIVKVDQKLVLRKAQLVVTKTAENITTGDKVVLLRVQGGKQYVVLDSVVSS